MVSSHPSRRLAPTLVAVVAMLLAVAAAVPARAATSGLLMSEYVEGSSFNKALEVYNGTGADVDLSGVAVVGYHNGATSPTYTVDLSGNLPAGEVFVLADSQASQAILDQADATRGGLWNGNDALVLTHDGAAVDSFGQVGDDTTFAANTTLRRRADACTGDTTPDDAFDAAADYEQFGSDTFDGLGSHSSTCAGGPAPTTAVINEFSASTTGTDVEYVEVLGPADTDLAHLTVLQVEGDASSSNFGTVVSNHAVGTTDGNGFHLMDLASNTLQNGTLSLLLVDGWTGEADVTGDLGTVVDSVGVNDGDDGDTTWVQAELDALFDGDANTFAPGGASRIPDGADTDGVDDWVRNDFALAGINDGDPAPGEAYNTPGTTNRAAEVVEPDPLECGADATPISSVQGAGDDSPLAGDTVVIEGIVVGDFQTGGFDGYYLQDAGDGEPATSDGVFVFDDFVDVEVAAGDRVRVQGEVSEFFGMTEVTADAAVVCATGNDLPDPVAVTIPASIDDLADFDGFERYEGMHVTFPQDLAILEYFNYDRFGEVVLGADRQFQPTAVFEPNSAEADALAAYNATARITLDDGRSGQNPDPAIHPNGDEFTLDNTFRGGDLVTNATGVLDYRFDLYRIQPTRGADFTRANPRPDVPDVGGRLQVAAFNVLNYFTTVDDGTNVCPDPSVGPDAGCRGADTTEEFDRQQAKIVAALTELDADIVGLMEIENSDTAVEELVAALNAHLGADTYAAIETGPVGTDAIKVGVIYKPDSVDPKGEFAVLDSSVDARFLDDKNRPALAQTFVEHGTGADLTVVVNHLKSKGSSCQDVGDPDDPVQGNCNGVRTAAAEALVDWAGSRPTTVNTDNVLITGDLNAYDMEDPIDVLRDGGYTDLLREHVGEFAYSYVFDGQLGYLDHALANDALADQVTAAAVWHSNTDEADLIDYDMSFKKDAQDALWAPDQWRASDHDAVVVGLDLDRPGRGQHRGTGQAG